MWRDDADRSPGGVTEKAGTRRTPVQYSLACLSRIFGAVAMSIRRALPTGRAGSA
jgi:hypothetical protein